MFPPNYKTNGTTRNAPQELCDKWSCRFIGFDHFENFYGISVSLHAEVRMTCSSENDGKPTLICQ
jgi:hypothetical protein